MEGLLPGSGRSSSLLEGPPLGSSSSLSLGLDPGGCVGSGGLGSEGSPPSSGFLVGELLGLLLLGTSPGSAPGVIVGALLGSLLLGSSPGGKVGLGASPPDGVLSLLSTPTHSTPSALEVRPSGQVEHADMPNWLVYFPGGHFFGRAGLSTANVDDIDPPTQ